jgi:chromosome segregation ATPase
VSLRIFDPSGFDNDIYAVEVHGLGRGRGVEVSERYSILQPGDETVELIKDRILNLSRLLLESDCLKPEEALSRLKIKLGDPQRVRMLRDEIEALEVNLEESREENAGLRRRLHRLLMEKESLAAELEEWERHYQKAFSESLEGRKELSKVYETITGLVQDMDEALGEWYEPEEDEEEDPLEALKERVKDLIEEYETLAAEAEEYE